MEQLQLWQLYLTIWLKVKLNIFQIMGVFIGLFGIVVLANPDNVYISTKLLFFVWVQYFATPYLQTIFRNLHIRQTQLF